ncbi:hypothetical protein [Halosegnis marinus]|uniref:hypothetical protein n=1 Tax=Halosegnis marinus TaxID=3034023 RepID=UPI003610E347
MLLVGLFYALAELLKRTGPDRRRSLAMLVEVFIGLLLFAGLAVVANNAAVIVSGGAAG